MLDLAIWPAPILKKKTEEVVEFDDELKLLADQMFETMYVHRGIGLAATQVNIDKRMLIMDVGHPRIMINPEIISASEEKVVDEEGCLSFSGFLVQVERPLRIKFKYQTLGGVTIIDEASDLESRCIQHEIDHLDGVTFLRYISRLHRDIIDKKMKKRIRHGR